MSGTSSAGHPDLAIQPVSSTADVSRHNDIGGSLAELLAGVALHKDEAANQRMTPSDLQSVSARVRNRLRSFTSTLRERWRRSRGRLSNREPRPADGFLAKFSTAGSLEDESEGSCCWGHRLAVDPTLPFHYRKMTDHQNQTPGEEHVAADEDQSKVEVEDNNSVVVTWDNF
uniref:Uncharacterized protein n=1 Tax=Timema douglasi TaxID=61478 RepID=A0A7R8VYN6_TIMDO|nr:unnamed protein product [Timema douglasi]